MRHLDTLIPIAIIALSALALWLAFTLPSCTAMVSRH